MAAVYSALRTVVASAPAGYSALVSAWIHASAPPVGRSYPSEETVDEEEATLSAKQLAVMRRIPSSSKHSWMSSATASVANVNDSPTGSVTVTGTATQGQTLTAGNTLADADGLGAITYQWLRDGVAIDGATSAAYTLQAADASTAVTVSATYTDAQYDQLAKHEIKWTDPSVKDALTTLAQVWGKPDYIAGGANGALQTDFPASVTQVFTGGDQPKAAMVAAGVFLLARLWPVLSGTDAWFLIVSLTGLMTMVVAASFSSVVDKACI